MRKIRINPVLLVTILLAGWIIFGIFKLEEQHDSQAALHLEESLRRAAVSCYAQEGFYPASLEHLLDHYVLSFDEDRYFIHYEYCGSNLMPHISVHLKS